MWKIRLRQTWRSKTRPGCCRRKKPLLQENGTAEARCFCRFLNINLKKKLMLKSSCVHMHVRHSHLLTLSYKAPECAYNPSESTVLTWMHSACCNEAHHWGPVCRAVCAKNEVYGASSSSSYYYYYYYYNYYYYNYNYNYNYNYYYYYSYAYSYPYSYSYSYSYKHLG